MTPPQTSREWNAGEYHRLSAPQFQWGQRVLSELHLRGDERVLDAGCGSGKLTRLLLQSLPQGRVVGVDLSRNMVRLAHDNLKADFAGRVRFVAGDLVALPFRECFDGIFSTASFHWVFDHDALFRNLFASLKKGGWLHAQCGGGAPTSRDCGNAYARSRGRLSLRTGWQIFRNLGSFPMPRGRRHACELQGSKALRQAWSPHPSQFPAVGSSRITSAHSYCIVTLNSCPSMLCVTDSRGRLRTPPRATIRPGRWITGG